MTVSCWDCLAVFEIATDMESRAYTTGTIQRRLANDPDSRWMGVCPKCQGVHDCADDPTKTFTKRRSTTQHADQTHNILLTADELREHDLTLTREASIHLAVELYFAPELEVNPAYRAYLIDHAS